MPYFLRSRHATPKATQRVQKSEIPRRASARLRGASPDTPASLGLSQSKEQVGTRRRQRRHHSEEEAQFCSEKTRPAARAKDSKSWPLNVENLERHTAYEGYVDLLELMAPKSANVRGRGSKRSVSNKRSASIMENGNDFATSTGGETPEPASQATKTSSYTAAHYRLTVLAGVNIIFRFLPAPEHIHNGIAAIVQRPVSEERKKELSLIAHTLHNQFAPVLSGAAREDDCVELFHQALSALGYSDSLLLPRRTDWEPSLKPRIPPPTWDLGILIPPQDDSLERPSKRQRRDGTYSSPDAAATGDTNLKDKDYGSGQIRRPPTSQWHVKTPRPNISIGLGDHAVVNALQSLDLTRKGAMELLKILAEPDARNGGKPLLCLGSTKEDAHIRFPFMPVEGKSYATGKTIYEAQNQAAVSGACALEILYGLDNLVQRVEPSSRSEGQYIVFSVCTQGPIHELWAHYMTEEDGDRIYINRIWKSCNMAVENEVPGFLEAVDNVMRWGAGEHMEKIVQQLKRISTHIAI